MGIKRLRKKAEGRSAWVLILKEALSKLYRLYANEEEEEEVEEEEEEEEDFW